MNVHHVGYVVDDLTEAAGTFATLGYRQCSEVTHDEARRVDICFVQNGAYCVELVAPWDEASVCWNILKSGGGYDPIIFAMRQKISMCRARNFGKKVGF